MTQKQIEFTCPEVLASRINESYKPLGFATPTEMIRYALRKYMEEAGVYKEGLINAK